MSTKPSTAGGYTSEQTRLVRSTCLYIATKLGDLLDDVVVVGGLVPTLLHSELVASEDHVGTIDLDIGLQIALLAEQRYEDLVERLQRAGFAPDTNHRGVRTRQRWKLVDGGSVTVDFLIPPSRSGDKGGSLRNILPDFAAIIAPGLRIAFMDRKEITLDGETIRGERAARTLQVCGVAAFVVMKALALRLRGENKDAYDIVYVVRASDIAKLGSRLRGLRGEDEVAEALAYLHADFATVDSVGPRRYSEFLYDRIDDNAIADAWGAVQTLLDNLEKQMG